MNAQSVEMIGIGIDTARYGHHVSFLDDQKRTAAPSFHFAESAQGYQQLFRSIEQLRKKHPTARIHCRIDAAGQYATNLIAFVSHRVGPIEVSIGQPSRNKKYREVHFEKRKADPTESIACARYAVVEKPVATALPDPAFGSLRDAVAQMEASAAAKTRLVNQLHNLLSRSFPELATIVNNLGAISILKLVEKYPTARRIAAARLSTLEALPHIKPDLAKRIQTAAKQSIASEFDETAEAIIVRKVKAIRREIDEHRQLAKIVEAALAKLPEGPHRRVAGICGIGPQTYAALVAKIVSIDRFHTANSLIGYFGIFPEEVDVSGTDKYGRPKGGRSTRMSSKGNDLVRRLLYSAAKTAAKHNPPVRALFARQMAAGKSYNVAMGHCMAKLLRQVFAVWKQDCEFDPDHETKADSSPPDNLGGDEELKTAAGHNLVRDQNRKVVTAATPSINNSADLTPEKPTHGSG